MARTQFVWLSIEHPSTHCPADSLEEIESLIASFEKLLENPQLSESVRLVWTGAKPHEHLMFALLEITPGAVDVSDAIGQLKKALGVPYLIFHDTTMKSGKGFIYFLKEKRDTMKQMREASDSSK